MSNKKLGIALIVGAVIVITLGVVLFMGSGSDYAKYANDKYIKLGEYKGLKYKYQERKVTKKDLEERIKAECQAKATSEEVKTGVIAEGDTVTLSYKGTVDGKKFTACEKEKGPVTVGSGILLGDLEKQIVGMHVGDEKEFTVKLPDDYQDEAVKGKDAKIKVKTYTLTKVKVPEYNDDFVKKNSEYKTKKEYEEALKKTLKKEKRDSALVTEKTSLMNEVISNSDVKKYPKDMLKKEKEKIIASYKDAAETQNVEWEDFLKNYVQMSKKDFEEFAETSAKNQVKWHLVIESIAKKENLKITDKEMSNRLKKLLKDSGFTEKTFKEQYNQSIEEYAKENDLKASFLEEKVRDFMYKNAKPTK